MRALIIKGLFFLVALVLLNTGVSAQNERSALSKTEWVDSVFQTLSTEDKIAQMMSVRAFSNKDEKHKKEILQLIKKYNIGGLTFFQGGPVRQAILTNEYQEASRIPMLIAQDAEWGLGMRLDSCHSFPYQMTLGAMPDTTIVHDIGLEIGKQLSLLGVHINLAPVVDINNNPLNPVIGYRSFGEDKYNVTEKSLAYINGLKEAGIYGVAKHFPGHGDTDTDSHYTLPVIKHNKDRLDTVELFPFDKLIDEKVNGIMIAHLNLPGLDPDGLPSTLSPKIVTGLLREEMGYKGIIISDALDMKGVTRDFKPGDIEVMALKAGNDILLLPLDVPKAIKKIKQAIKRDEIEEQKLNERCKALLAFKYDAGLANSNEIKIDSLTEKLNSPESRLLSRKVYQEAITVVKNSDSLLPVDYHPGLNMSLVSVTNNGNDAFSEMVSNYARFEHIVVSPESSVEECSLIKKELEDDGIVIIAIHSISSYAKDYGIPGNMVSLIHELSSERDVVVVLFGNAYSLSRIAQLDSVKSIVIAYQNSLSAQEVAAQIVMGALGSHGNLPVSPADIYPCGTGIKIQAEEKMTFVIPEELGIDENVFFSLDSLIFNSIDEEVFPGCQILAAKNNQVFFHKAYGYHTYQKQTAVKKTDLYDLASITKIAASTISLMRLDMEGKIDIDQPVSRYLPFLLNTNKEHVVIREMMAHQARLTPWIPFYMGTLDKEGDVNNGIYSNTISEDFPDRVAQNLYIKRNYLYRVFDTIVHSDNLSKSKYRYSDLGYYFLQRIVENASNCSLDEYVKKSFYDPMGLWAIGYKPLKAFSTAQIVPTEDDKIFRKQLLHGDVHDPGAAMMGGVAGHAGLFSNAQSLAVLMYMLLNHGYYNGVQYLDSTKIQEYTRCQFPLNDNRRGIGFDKPLLEFYEDGPVCRGATLASFGHSGFTGTYTWADPDNGLIYVFLSNRVFPDASNNEISKRNIRTTVHQMFYDALKKAR